MSITLKTAAEMSTERLIFFPEEFNMAYGVKAIAVEQANYHEY